MVSGPTKRDGSASATRLIMSRLSRALRAEQGVATIEFCMVLPIVLFLVLLLVQSTLLMVGNQYVHYAAFAATRSAIVYIPQDDSLDGEPRNEIIPEPGFAKFDAIRAAAYLAVAPVCGRLENSSDALQAEQYADGLRDYFGYYGKQTPRWVDTLAADRLRYAAENTEVTILITDVIGDTVSFDDSSVIAHTFGPREPITVRIEHKLNLSVPYVGAIFADGDLDGGGRYALVTAQYTLTNEGVDPDLPDPPQIPRDDR